MTALFGLTRWKAVRRPAMRFGLLYEAQRPFKGTDIDWNKLYKEMFGKHVIPACRTSARRAPVTAGTSS
jgi:hypothetical protein